MALYYHLQGKTLDEVWLDLGKRFGYHEDIVYSIEFQGSSGQAKMDKLMDGLHNNPLKELDGVKVVKVEDYLKQETYEGNKVTKINLVKSNVVKLYFENGNTVAVRPSGTEPKVKFYIGVVGSSLEEARALPDKLYDLLKKELGI